VLVLDLVFVHLGQVLVVGPILTHLRQVPVPDLVHSPSVQVLVPDLAIAHLGKVRVHTHLNILFNILHNV
jgi:hypothetical protein